jgi:hypothetical protein
METPVTSSDEIIKFARDKAASTLGPIVSWNPAGTRALELVELELQKAAKQPAARRRASEPICTQLVIRRRRVARDCRR